MNDQAPRAEAFAGSVDIPTLYPSPNEAHYPTCTSLRKPPEDYELGNPDSEQHCRTCHCSCDPDGPTCGHTAGCPGC